MSIQQPAPAPLTGCETRPRVLVTTVPLPNGQLQVRVVATTSVGLPVNAVRALKFTKLDNAGVLFNGVQVAEGSTVDVPAGATDVLFIVGRVTGGQATTVAFAAIDGCGEWPSLVGGGPNGF